MNWLRYWGLSRAPFNAPDAPFVAVPTPSAAIDRLVHAIDRGCRNVALIGGPGSGKTMVLRRALARSSGPGRKIVLVRMPAGPDGLLEMFAERLGPALGPFSRERPDGWRALGRALRVEALQGKRVILAIDDWDEGRHARASRDLDALAHHALGPCDGPTIVRAGRPAPGDRRRAADGDRGPVVVLRHWTRSDADVFLRERLAAAGRSEGPFTPRAITRIHGLARGVPRSVERLAALSLIAAAERGHDTVSPEIVDAVVESGPETLIGLAS